MSELNQYIKAHRNDFSGELMEEKNLPTEPHQLFELWLQQAIDKNCIEPYAMVLTTVKDNFMPSSRVVYLRGWEGGKLIFYTNYMSEKVQDIFSHPNVSLNFHWADVHRQVRIVGPAIKANKSTSDDYFESRPRESKIGAWASPQSQKIQGRSELQKRFEEIEKKFEGIEVPRPEHWGGIEITPNFFEFWVGRPSRLHDRIVYQRGDSVWERFRLAP